MVRRYKEDFPHGVREWEVRLIDSTHVQRTLLRVDGEPTDLNPCWTWHVGEFKGAKGELATIVRWLRNDYRSSGMGWVKYKELHDSEMSIPDLEDYTPETN